MHSRTWSHLIGCWSILSGAIWAVLKCLRFHLLAKLPADELCTYSRLLWLAKSGAKSAQWKPSLMRTMLYEKTTIQIVMGIMSIAQSNYTDDFRYGSTVVIKSVSTVCFIFWWLLVMSFPHRETNFFSSLSREFYFLDVCCWRISW